MRAVKLTQRDARHLARGKPRVPRASATPRTPAAVPAVLCAIDPGVMHCGYAVLHKGQYCKSGTLIPQKLTGVDGHHGGRKRHAI